MREGPGHRFRPIVIGQAAEFDYAGTQACRALREEGVAGRPGQLQPGHHHDRRGSADRVYIEPLDLGESDGDHRQGAAGRPAAHPGRADRPEPGGGAGRGRRSRPVRRGAAGHAARRRSAGPRTASCSSRPCWIWASPCRPAPSCTISTEAEAFAAECGYPLIVRPAYTLGGTGGGIAADAARNSCRSSRGDCAEPHPPGAGGAERRRVEGDRVRGDARRRRQLHHRLQHGELRPGGRPHRATASWWRPARPCPTRSTRCCATASLSIIRALGIEGGCNVQFALDPREPELRRHRGQPPGQPLLRPGLQGHRLPHRQGGGQDRRRPHAWTRSRTP